MTDGRDTDRLLSPALLDLERCTDLLSRVQAKHDELVLRCIVERHPRKLIADAAGVTVWTVYEHRRRASGIMRGQPKANGDA